MEWKQVLTKSDHAKYPFMSETAEHVKEIDLEINELESEDFNRILNKAEDRIEKALIDLPAYMKSRPRDDEIEIFSFPIAVMMAAATGDQLIKRRYALAEAKRVSDMLKDERKEKVMAIAKNFNWKIRLVEDISSPYNFALHFTDFLKNATEFRDKKWKLVNRLVLNGEVYLTKSEASRLLEEEVRRHIEEKLSTKVGSLPQGIMDRVNRLKQLVSEKRGEIQLEEVPRSVVIAAFPPCIKGVYDTIMSGRSTSHIGRFALTSFLINIGMTVDNIIDLFRSVSDFDERMTRYQVEHIAGVRGSRTKYIPPRCGTLRTHGICLSPDEICKKIRHPLAYYRRKLKKAEATAKQV
ncbi:MAG: DNA primase large subunit PriL [Candidatus Bathyarchaeota archaeon BA2]|nr:MAG: DNA primase large subunit PriL [Candidatus Bathyarchaeota archaeon BA2]